MWWSDTWRVFLKDWRIELRSKELITTMGFFALVLVVVFSVGFVPQGQEVTSESVIVRRAMPGILWVTLCFAGVLSLSRAFDRERESDTLRALLLTPMKRSAVYAGKTLAILLFMILVEVVVIAACWFLFGAPFGQSPGHLAAIMVLGTVGFACIGSTFSAMLMRVRSRDVLLPVILFPVLMPLLIAATKGTAACLVYPADTDSAFTWITFLGAFDIIFLVAAFWIFESMVVD